MKEITWKRLSDKEDVLLDDGVFDVSLVSQPANEQDLLLFSKSIEFAVTNKEKQIVTGVVLIPGQKIYRTKEVGGKTEEYEGVMDDETIASCAYDYMQRRGITYQHAGPAKDVQLIESWVSKTKNELGFQIPKGTWLMSMRINNQQLWQQCKAGLIKGFSIEGKFSEIELSKQFTTEEDIINALTQILNTQQNGKIW